MSDWCGAAEQMGDVYSLIHWRRLMQHASLQMHHQVTYLCFAHVALEQVIVDDDRGVLDVEMAGHPPQLCHVQVAALLIKARHLALL